MGDIVQGSTAATSDAAWPVKTRELHTEHFDSTVWNDFAFRSDDIVIATWGKSGTTWSQQIVTQLIFEGAEGLDVSGMSPWLDMRFPSKEEKLQAMEAQTHRRCIKTHLPVDALVFSPDAKYLYLARDGRDVMWSLHNHFVNAVPQFYEMLNGPGLVGPPLERPTGTARDFFLEFLDKDATFQPFWPHVRGWWDIRHLPNVMLMHYQDLKDDMAGGIRRIAEFLDLSIDEAKWPSILEHCSFDYMKEHGEENLPGIARLFEDGAKTFINKGSNGRWRDVLTAEECARYEETARRELGEECAAWLKSGSRAGAAVAV